MDAEQDELPRPTGANLGTAVDDEQAKYAYLDYVQASVKSSFQGYKIVLDCAHGAAYELAPKVFEALGAEVITVGAEPNGCNINDHCGSTHPEALQKAVLEHGAFIGFAFDGDADRLIAIDETGEEVDGDYILSICGHALNQSGQLQQSTIVTTVMSNIGFLKALKR